MNDDGTDSDRIAELLARVMGTLGIETEPQQTDDYLALIAAASEIETQARHVLRDAVVSARSAGATWSAIGATLGMTKQAAQKRFPVAATPAGQDLDAEERIIGPLTAFNEMSELELAGAYGWHSIDFGPYFHKVVRSDTQWEHKRVSMLRRSAKSLQEQGWQLIRSEFPFSYLKRDLGIPALVESESGS